MAKTLGCSDFDQACDFRITADDDQEDFLLEVAFEHAILFHPEFEPDQELLREALRGEIKLLSDRTRLPGKIVASR